MKATRPIRSMFRRRLTLLLGLVLVACAAMGVQLARLTVVEHGTHVADAERRLYAERWMPTVRGRILDRHGRVLAQDRPSYEAAVDYRVLSGAWADERASSFARRAHRDAWPLLDAQARERLVERYRQVYDAHVSAMWTRLASISAADAPELESRRARILARVDRMAGTITDARRRQAIREQAARGRQFTPELLAQIDERAAGEIAEQRRPHAVLPDLDDATAFLLMRLAEQSVPLFAWLDDPSIDRDTALAEQAPLLPGLVVRRSSDREYPFDRVTVEIDRSTYPGPLKHQGHESVTVEGVAAHVLGWMGRCAIDIDAASRREALSTDNDLHARATVRTLDGRTRDRGQYMPGDPAGRAGIERAREARLRGLRGLELTRLDLSQRTAVDPDFGRDVHLTLDVMLQARVQAAMSPEVGLARVHDWHGEDNPTMPVGEPLNGGAVVLDVDTGEVLALVSMPSFNRDVMRDDPESIAADEREKPYLNRAVGVAYPPGSVAKALMLSEAVTRGNYSLNQRIECTGHLFPNLPNNYRCWVYRERFGFSTHQARMGHPLDAVEALTVSCNIFFYTLGQRLGPRDIEAAYRDFGVGERFGLGVGPEHAGTLGPDGNAAALSTSDAILMGIGQGPVDWTPMHAASAYATLARMGVVVRPRLIDDGAPPEVRELGLNRPAVQAALEGLDRVVNDSRYGTAHAMTINERREPIFNAPGVRVRGKTGTATAPDLRIDPDGPDGPLPRAVVRSGDHSWFVVLVGREGERPRYSIAVVMEYAGSGGRVAGPIANQIIHALIAEGYL